MFGFRLNKNIPPGQLKNSLGARGPFPIVAVATFTGGRRSEILTLRWSNLDIAVKTLRIERALEETKDKGPTSAGVGAAQHLCRSGTIDDVRRKAEDLG